MTVPAWFSLTVGITGFTVLAVVVILWWEDQPARVRGRQLIADTEAWLHGGRHWPARPRRGCGTGPGPTGGRVSPVAPGD